MAHPYDGVWDLDTGTSTMWDVETSGYVPEPVSFERITLRHDGDIQDYEVLYGDEPQIRMTYTARFDDTAWKPYAVQEISDVPEGLSEEEAVARFREQLRAPAEGLRRRNFTVGQNYAKVRLISVNERVHYRLTVQDDLSPQTMLMRKLDEDGGAYTTYLMDPVGIVFRVRRFVRVA